MYKIVKKLNNILKQQLQMENQYNTQNSENLARNIATIKMNENQDKIYHPSKRVAMWSQVSCTIAEIFLQHIENKHIKQLLDSKIITFYTRYVDDIFIIYDKNRTTVNKMQTYLDLIHKNLKLTPTFEDNTQINFLDILIIRKKNDLSINIYKNRQQQTSPSTTYQTTRWNKK
jgi:hypothetical protein